jgi:cytochrome c551/c552
MYATKLTCFLLLLLAFTSCNQSVPLNGKLKADNLPSQQVTISTSRENFIRLSGGTIIHVPANALKNANGDSVKLEIKEALTVEQMLAAGLYTRSNGRLLASGGMLYVGPKAGQDVKILQPMKVIVPADHIQDDMQLFKGELKDTAINWVDPQPLEVNKGEERMEHGKSLFQSNCSQCHSVTKKLTGPALFGAIQRWGNDTAIVYAYTRNSAAVMAKSCKANCIFDEYMIQMPAYPSFTNEDLDDIYRYIHEEGMKQLGSIPAELASRFECDCCDYIRQLEDSLGMIAAGRFEMTYQLPEDSSTFNGNGSDQGTVIITPTVTQTLPPPPPVNYTFDINTFGWYNIDAILKMGPTIETMNIKVVQEGLTTPTLYPIIVIPSIKVIQPGSISSDGSYFYFYEENGELYLPPNTPGYIFELGEKGDKFLFGITKFVTGGNQTIKINVQESNGEQVQAAIGNLKLPGVDVKVKKIITIENKLLQSRLNDLLKRYPHCKCYGEK